MVQLRFLGAAIVSVAITLAVFYLMFGLITDATARPAPPEPGPSIHFGPIDLPDEAARKPPRPPKPERPVPRPPPEMPQAQPPERVVVNLELEPPVLPPIGDSIGYAVPQPPGHSRSEEGDVVALVRVQPNYPPGAAVKGLEGWVRVAFIITPNGAVTNPRVIEANPPQIFNQEALRAILKWKFKPRIVNGEAVERSATQVFDFSLEKA